MQNQNERFIKRMMDVSTVHFQVETLEWLAASVRTDQQGQLIVYKKGEYGYFIPILQALSDCDEDLPEDLEKAITFAAEHHCAWLLIDHGASMIEDMITNWI